MTNLNLSLLKFLLTLGALTCLPAWAQDKEISEDLNTIYSTRTRQEFEGLNLKDSLALSDFSKVKWRYNHTGSIALPSESVAKPDGIFYVRDARINSSLSTPPSLSFFSEPVVRLVPCDGIGQEDCRKIAMDFAAANFSWFFDKSAPSPTIEGPDRMGNYTLTWQKYREDELPDTRVWIQVRSIDGKIIGFSSSRFSGEWPHKVSPTQAKEKAIAYFAAQKKLSDPHVAEWYVSGGGGKRWYGMRVEATETNTKKPFSGYVEVDADSGTAFSQPIDGDYVAEKDTHRASVSDTMPVWTKAGLVFISNRPLSDRPDWFKGPPQLAMRSLNGDMSYLTCDLAERYFLELGGSNNNDWISLAWKGWTYGLNLNTGEHSVLTTPTRRIPHAIVTANGTWIASYGATPEGEKTVNAAFLTNRKLIYTHGRLKKARANIQNLVVSPDEKWLYALSVQYVNWKPKWSIYRVSMQSLQKSVPAEIPPGAIQLIANNIPAEVTRLSLSSDGKILILQTEKGVFALEVTKKSLRQIPLSFLKDNELGGTRILDIQDAWTGPNSDEVTFSGRTKSKQGEIRRIYSCRLDGTSLSSWSPATLSPIPSYQFPATSKSADDWNKTVILKEIEWEEMKRGNS